MHRELRIWFTAVQLLGFLHVPAQATEGDVLFVLLKTNPLAVFSVFDPLNSNDQNSGSAFTKKIFLETEIFNQAEASQTLAMHQHTFRAVAQNMNGSTSTFFSIRLATAYEPQDPRNHLRIKNNDPINRTDLYGFTSGAQHSDGNRWWAVAFGYNHLRKRDDQTLEVVENRQALTAQYLLFDRSFSPYVISGFIGVDAGIGGIYARFTPYVALQEGLLIGPDFQVYHDTNTHKLKIGGALAGLRYQRYEAMISLGYEQDHIGHQGGYFSLGVARRF